MNDVRRRKMRQIEDELKDYIDRVKVIQREEFEYYETFSEETQIDVKGYDTMQRIENMECAMHHIERAINCLEYAI